MDEEKKDKPPTDKPPISRPSLLSTRKGSWYQRHNSSLFLGIGCTIGAGILAFFTYYTIKEKEVQKPQEIYQEVSQYTSDISEKFPELAVADTKIAEEATYAAPSQEITEKRYNNEMVELFAEYLSSDSFVKIQGKTFNDISDKCLEGFATFLPTVNKDVKSKYSDEVLTWIIANVYNSNPCDKYISGMLKKGGFTLDNQGNIIKDGKNVEVVISPK